MKGASSLFDQEYIRCKKCDIFLPRNQGLPHIKRQHGWNMGSDYSFEEFFEVIK